MGSSQGQGHTSLKVGGSRSSQGRGHGGTQKGHSATSSGAASGRADSRPESWKARPGPKAEANAETEQPATSASSNEQ